MARCLGQGGSRQGIYRRRSEATKKPSVSWSDGKITSPAPRGVAPKLSANPAGSKSGCPDRKSATTFSFSHELNEHVAYTKRPPGRTWAANESRRRRWVSAARLICASVVVHFKCGARRHVPEPL